MFSTDWLNYGNLNFYSHDINKLSFFKKYILSVYPDISNINYNYSNSSVIYLTNFRENNFPVISEVVENNFYKQHRVSLKEFNSIGNFILSSKRNNYFNLFLLKNFKNSNKYSFLHNLYIFLFFLENNFYFLLTFKHFSNVSKRNFTKFNFLFLLLLKKIKKNVLINSYDLNKVSDWSNYLNDSLKHIPFVSNKYKTDNLNFYKFGNLNNTITHNLQKVIKIGKNFNTNIYLNDIIFNFKNLNSRLFNINSNLSNFWKINFSESSTNKHIDLTNNFLKRSNFVFFFLRKNKIFNKGRYSRNRQTYRTGFYWCLWINIFAIYGLHYAFYRFTFVFGYLWIFFIIFVGSFIFSRMLKYNFHNFNFILNEFNNFFRWLGFLSTNLYNFLLNISRNLFNFFKSISFFSNHTQKPIWLKSLSNFFFNLNSDLKKNLNSVEHTHVWYYLSSNDESFFKIYSKKNFLNQFFFKN